jgi:hypothetical protein
MSFDQAYAIKGAEYNKAIAAKTSFMQQRGDLQGLRVQGMNGFATGAYYGSVAGLARSIYARKLRHIPVTAGAFGLAYAGVLTSSIWWRMDI